MHGEDEDFEPEEETELETPPHAWGRLIWSDTSYTGNGNTPTCMGKTILKQTTTSMIQKHPHMHGEDSHINATSAR